MPVMNSRKSCFGIWLSAFTLLIFLAACTVPAASPAPPTEVHSATAVVQEPPADTAAPSASPAPILPPTEIPAAHSPPAPPALDLAEPGPFYAGNRAYTFVDSSRSGRVIKVTIWYPALEQKDANGRSIHRDAAPDASGAPYPLILTETASGGTIFTSHLATHGFVMAQITIPDHDDFFNTDFQMIAWPLDYLFVLEQIAAQGPAGLEGVIDVENVGVTGYSYCGDIALTLAGVRIDPQDYLEHCAQLPHIEALFRGEGWYHEYSCDLSKKWEAFTDFAGEQITSSQDELWQPLTDERIRAVMPMAPTGGWLYGERGLAAADSRPVLLIVGTEDEFSPYSIETAFIFEHLGSPERSLISFIGRSHMMVQEAEIASRVKHFATAFFGFHLQGQADYQQYYSQDFVSRFEDLYWGLYPGD